MSDDANWSGDEGTVAGMPVRKPQQPPQTPPAGPDWRGEEGTVAGMPAHRPPSPSPSADPDWRGEEGTVAGMPAYRAHAPSPSSSDPEWRGEEGTVAGMPAHRAQAPSPSSADPEWRGEEGTVAGMPAHRAPPSPSADPEWRGEEGTVAGLPAHRASPPSSPSSEPEWRGEEGTVAGLPAHGAPAQPAAEADWRGEEGTVPGLPGSGRPRPPGVQEWRGDEGTIPGLPGRQPVRMVRPDQDATPRPVVRDLDATPRTVVASTQAPAASAPGGSSAPGDDWHLQGRTGELTGQSFGDYEIGRILGEGGMGIIYRARQRSLNRRVAVKTLSSAYSQDPLQRARFEIEARAASLIQSPHVVAVFAAGSYNDIIYFVMEYVEGNHLGNVIAERARTGRGLDPPAALDYILQAARGLSTAAGRGIVHRDIKPSNLLITRNGTVKIADFGISKIAGESNLTRTGTAVGTPSYISPEQGRGEATDGRSDLYSLGVVLYEALTGQKPFTGDNADAIIYQHNYAEPKALRTIDPSIPETYQAVVVRCLQKDPAKRYQSADELIADIERIKAGDVSVTAMLQARYGTGAEDAMRRRLGRRQRWIIPVAAGLLLLSAVGGGFWWWQSDLEQQRKQEDLVKLLRQRLHEGLDAPVRVPASAGPDMAAMARLTGSGDADLVRWQAKMTKVEGLRARLARLDARELPNPQLRDEAVADLSALAELVGPDSPEQVRWRARLTEAADKIASLRQHLAALDAVDDVTVAQRESHSPFLAQLNGLVGDGDPDALRWKRRFEALAERLAELGSQLKPLSDPKAVYTEEQLARFQTALDELRRRHGSVPASQSESEAREAMNRQRAAIARLRDILRRFDEAAVASASTLARAEPELKAYRLRVAADDADLMRWEQKADAARYRIAELEEHSAILDRADGLTEAELADASKAIEDLRPLIDGNNAQLRSRSAHLRTAQGAIAAWRADLLPLDSPNLPVAIRGRASTALAELDRRLAISEADKQKASQRLDEEERRFIALRQRCAVASGDVAVSQALVDDIQLYGRLAGDDDADFQKWRLKIVDYVELRSRLAVLDRPAELPKGVDADLDAFARIVGDDDRALQGWRSKVKRVRELSVHLAPLSAVAPLPGGAEDGLAELRALLGEFASAPTWAAKIARVRNLTAACTTEFAPESVLLAPGSVERLQALQAEIGQSAEIAAWQERARILAGPGRPDWASAYSVDAQGPRAVWTLNASGTSLPIAFRHVPAGAGMIGSPDDEAGREGDEQRFRVRLTRGRWIAECETNQALWAAVTGAWPAADRDPQRPVERVSWNDVQAFLGRLRELAPGVPVRLPTEAEWEHACRAGGADPAYASGDPSALDRRAWYRATSGDRSQPVGRRAANALGLFDLAGNVWEWCEDRYGSYPIGEAVDPLGSEREQRVARGGGWGDRAPLLRAANRVALDPGVRSAALGFRLLIDAGQ